MLDMRMCEAKHLLIPPCFFLDFMISHSDGTLQHQVKQYPSGTEMMLFLRIIRLSPSFFFFLSRFAFLNSFSSRQSLVMHHLLAPYSRSSNNTVHHPNPTLNMTAPSCHPCIQNSICRPYQTLPLVLLRFPHAHIQDCEFADPVF